ncbi:nucleotidyl transferase AbiEii/AbiGii toxin family protein [Schaalia naturae]|uniref:Nucleotidyl transferase AbiEii/AbiGii toxin family protein n=1 Tax=Schaalia naturae TaxID=635203 RepID=A0ABW2SJP7_9ACTO
MRLPKQLGSGRAVRADDTTPSQGSATPASTPTSASEAGHEPHHRGALGPALPGRKGRARRRSARHRPGSRTVPPAPGWPVQPGLGLHGTALRKFRAGNSGRFSTDLDFTAPGNDLPLAALEALDGAGLDGFSFAVENLGDDGRRGGLRIETPFGRPDLGAKIELARHRLSLAPDVLDPIRLPIHSRYDFTVPPTPVIRTEEAIAEKLARFRRVSLARDLYDLQWYATNGIMNEPLVRRL